MNEQLQNDILHFDNLLEAVKLQGLDFLKQLSDRPTSTKPNLQLNESLNETGMGALDALQLFNEKFENLVVGSAGPMYWGFVSGGSTPGSIRPVPPGICCTVVE